MASRCLVKPLAGIAHHICVSFQLLPAPRHWVVSRAVDASTSVGFLSLVRHFTPPTVSQRGLRHALWFHTTMLQGNLVASGGCVGTLLPPTALTLQSLQRRLSRQLPNLNPCNCQQVLLSEFMTFAEFGLCSTWLTICSWVVQVLLGNFVAHWFLETYPFVAPCHPFRADILQFSIALLDVSSGTPSTNVLNYTGLCDRAKNAFWKLL